MRLFPGEGARLARAGPFHPSPEALKARWGLLFRGWTPVDNPVFSSLVDLVD